MPTIQETAYPRLKTSLSEQELAVVYMPTSDEIALARSATRGDTPFLGFLVLLKTFQRLGYFVLLSQVPTTIVEYIAEATQTTDSVPHLAGYDVAGTRFRHLQVIRDVMQVQAFGKAGRHAMLHSMREAAATKEDLADLINVAIEELVRQKYELPAFDTLVRAARHVRTVVYRQFYHQVDVSTDHEAQARIGALFATDAAPNFTLWNTLRQEPGSPTLTHLKIWLDRQTWLSGFRTSGRALSGIPEAKVRHFAAEARTLDAARMLALEPRKRLTLALALLHVQSARVLDDLADMLIKRMSAIHHRGKDALANHRTKTQQRTDDLVMTLRDVVSAYRQGGTDEERMGAIQEVLGERDEELLQQCDEHMAYAGDNYYPFLWRYYKSHRATLFRLLKAVTVCSSSQDLAFQDALGFLLDHERCTGDWLALSTDPSKGEDGQLVGVDLSWIPDGWWRLVTGERTRDSQPARLNRRHFEVCVFSQLMWELKSGDAYIVGSDRYADYRDQLITWEEYDQSVAAYGEMVGIAVTGEAFVQQMQAKLTATAEATNRSFPDNQYVRIERGEPVLRKLEKAPEPAGLSALEAFIGDHLEPVNILDVLRDTEHWLNWTRFFSPISGHDAKLDDPASRYLATAFCYGCYLGPTQAARSLRAVDRRQLAWINLRHVTEEKLDRAIREVINAYHRFALPKRWGSGKRASADGTKWDLYEQNLLAECHIRYGGYGGIGYYHVSDTYIALFSHFIPCGVWEAVYILDGLLKNQSGIQPDTIHADTQGQSAPVFGLATLLGISLMPRIRNWKDLKLFRPSKGATFQHIDGLFSDPVDWELIRTHLPDMLRVVLSIKAGRITASTILRKLGTYTRKNRLYQAFRELGRVVRTEFLLNYLSDPVLRATIQAATNKSEAFNGFAQWVGFGGDGTITENDRDEQRKVVKYNHLVANCIILYNVYHLSRVLGRLKQSGHELDDAAVAALSPYITHYINRFGDYDLDMATRPPELVYDLRP